MKRKRPNGSGTLRKRKNGLWECTIMIGRDPITGKILTKTFYSRTQAGCIEKRDAYLRDRRDGLIDALVTFKPFAERWYNHHAVKKAPATQESYRHTLNLIYKTKIADMLLKAISVFDIEDVLSEIHAEYSHSTYTKCRGTLYMIMDAAVALDLVRKNVVNYAERLEQKRSQSKQAFTVEEILMLIKKLPLDKLGLTIRAMLVTGVRRQEILGVDISKGHIPPDGSYLKIEQAVKLKKGKSFLSTTKNPNSIRIVPVPEEYRPYLVLLRNCCDGLLWESPKKPGTGQPINPATFDKAFKNTLTAIEGVHVLTPHCCRHTYITQLHAAGVDLDTICALSGHSLKGGNARQYLHIRDEVKLKAVEKFAASLKCVQKS